MASLGTEDQIADRAEEAARFPRHWTPSDQKGETAMLLIGLVMTLAVFLLLWLFNPDFRAALGHSF